MILKFEAEAVEIEENDLNILCVGFYAEENYLMIQQSLEIENAAYHIERDDQSFGTYGGVENIELSRDQVDVRLNEDGKSALDCDGVIIDFETDDETFGLLTEKLKFIFGSSFTVK
ncbi:MAG: hypothetical protein LUM44_01675 [Pyrinomonadaceae bacterium]|nr:hypothetical protein [Pyrinomonadaceae bacterium]